MTKDEASQWLETLAAKFRSANDRELLNEEVVLLLENRRRELEQVFLTGAVQGFRSLDCSAVLEVLSERKSQIQKRENRAEDLGGSAPGNGSFSQNGFAGHSLHSGPGVSVPYIEVREAEEVSAAEKRVEEKGKDKLLNNRFRKTRKS